MPELASVGEVISARDSDAVINLGRRHGLTYGTVFGGEQIMAWAELIEERTSRLRTCEKLSVGMRLQRHGMVSTESERLFKLFQQYLDKADIANATKVRNLLQCMPVQLDRVQALEHRIKQIQSSQTSQDKPIIGSQITNINAPVIGNVAPVYNGGK